VKHEKSSAAKADSMQKYHIQLFCGLQRSDFDPRRLLRRDRKY
jgi:hypothetical protein